MLVDRSLRDAVIEVMTDMVAAEAHYRTIGIDNISHFLRACRQKLANQINIETPYSCWMVKAKGLDAVPVPNEEVAKAWAEKSGGRAFLVMEVVK